MIFTRDALARYAKGERQIIVGVGTYGVPELLWDDRDLRHSLRIGNYCSIATNVKIFVGWFGDHNHQTISTYPIGMLFGVPGHRHPSKHEQKKRDVVIGHDVWIGRDVIIKAGVTIGHGAVIGMRSVVTRDVEPYSIVGGDPAKEIKKRFTCEVIRQLLELKWWDWSDEMIRTNVDLFFDEDFEQKLLNVRSPIAPTVDRH